MVRDQDCSCKTRNSSNKARLYTGCRECASRQPTSITHETYHAKLRNPWFACPGWRLELCMHDLLRNLYPSTNKYKQRAHNWMHIKTHNSR